MPTDVEKLLNEDDGEDYGEDGFEEEPKKPSGSILAAAAATVDREEKTATAKLLNVAAKEIKRSTSTRAADDDEDDVLAKAAKEVYRESHDDADDADDEEGEGGGDEGKEALNAVYRIGCFRGNLKQVRDVLEKGASLKSRDRHGWSALHWAASSNSFDIVRFLLKEASAELPTRALRAFVNCPASDTGWTPVMVAVIKGAVDSLEALLDCPVTSLEKKNLLGETAAECVPADKSSASNRLRKLLGVAKAGEGEAEAKEGGPEDLSFSQREEEERDEDREDRERRK